MIPILKYKKASAVLLLLGIHFISFSQVKLIVRDAKINLSNSSYITTYDLSLTGSSLLNVNNSTLRIRDSIQSNANINLRYGVLELIGFNAQPIPANAFVNNAVKDLIISNSSAGGVSLLGALDLYNSLTYSGTGMKLLTNDTLTFKSIPGNTAWLGNMTGNTITGKATLECYLSPRKAWRFLSIPTNTTQSIRETWQEGATATGLNPVTGYGIQLSGPGGTAAGFDLYSATPPIKMFSSSTGTWVGVPGTLINITSTGGYMTFIRGDRTANTIGSPVTPTVLRTKGTLYTGDLPPIAVNAGMFAAIGNPYPSEIDLRNINKDGIKDFFYVWDAALAGNSGYGAYQTFSNDGNGDYVITPGSGSYGANGSISNYISSGQAFLVQGDSIAGTLTFNEGAKSTGNGVVSFARGIPEPQLRANLYGVNADSTTYLSDGLLVKFNDNYSNGVDGMDAVKLTNTSENLAVRSHGKLLVVERRHTLAEKDTIFLNLVGASDGKYRFELLIDQIHQPGRQGFLKDSYLDISTPLNIDGTTQLNFNVTSDIASKAPDRFMIVFGQLGTLPVNFSSVKAYTVNKDINVMWKVENEMNIKKYEIEKSVDGNKYTMLSVTGATGNNGHSASYVVTDTHPVQGYNYYRIKSIALNNEAVYSNVVSAIIGNVQPGIVLYPNPVSKGSLNLQFNSQPGGPYTIRVLNKMCQVIVSKDLQHVAGSSHEIITFDEYVPHGMYQLEIIKPDGSASFNNMIY